MHEAPETQPGWHGGELEMQRRLGVPTVENPTVRGLPDPYVARIERSPLLALGTSDRQGRVWTSVLGGSVGAARRVADGVLGLTTSAHLERRPFDGAQRWVGLDPVLETLLSEPEPQSVHGASADQGRLVSGLAIDLEHRDRVKIAGRLTGAGVVVAPAGEERTPRADVRLAVAVEESLGNCPKYLNKRIIAPRLASPELVSASLPLPAPALELIAKADLFFLTSRHGDVSMDTNNRGGAPGFVRVATNSEEAGVELVYPEYSGNRLMQSLGNLAEDPAVGMTFPDFETGDVLYLSGRAEVLVGDEAESVLPRSALVVRVHVEHARFVADALPFRGQPLERSPYNPPVRMLRAELPTDGASVLVPSHSGEPRSIARARVIDRIRLTPTVSKYLLRLSPDGDSSDARRVFREFATWRPGQHVTLSFAGELSQGWSHMRDHDPSSLNDDFIRSFTVSSRPNPAMCRARSDAECAEDSAELEITVREGGPVTRHLAKWVPGDDLEVPVLAFGGVAHPDSTDPGAQGDEGDLVIIAGGVGITPTLTLGPAALQSGRIRVLWALRAEDLALAADVFDRIEGLADATDLFITGAVTSACSPTISALAHRGVAVHSRRLRASDLHLGRGSAPRIEVCAGRSLTASVLGWAAGEEVHLRSFDF